MLTTETAGNQARNALENVLGLGRPELSKPWSRYCDLQGRTRPRYAASHIRTEVGYGVVYNKAGRHGIAYTPDTADVLWEMATVLRSLPGAVAAGTFLGDYDRNLRPSAWVLREVDPADQPTRLAVTRERGGVLDHGTIHQCPQDGRRFVGRADAVYCSPACRQRAYRQRITSTD